MLINPKIAVEEGWITGLVNPEKQIQPNAIDFTLDNVYSINQSPFIISETKKQVRGGMIKSPLHLDPFFTDGHKTDEVYWILAGHTTYDGLSDVFVKLPEGVAATLIVRSSFNRNGVFLTSGLYDSGYEGHIGFAIHNMSQGDTHIAPGTRIGQICFWKSDSARLYAGGYNHEEGTHHSPQDVAPHELDCDGAEARDNRK